MMAASIPLFFREHSPSPGMFARVEGVCDTRLHVILNVYYKKWGIRTEVPTPRVPDLMIDVRNDE